MTLAIPDFITIERLIDAPREIVYKTWTDQELAKKWWGPKGFQTTYCQIDLHPGGLLHRCIKSPEGREYWAKGIIQEAKAPERFVYIGSLSDEQGKSVSASDQQGLSQDWSLEMLITINFEEDHGKTRLKIKHEGVSQNQDERDACERTWNETLDRLEEYLTKSPHPF